MEVRVEKGGVEEEEEGRWERRTREKNAQREKKRPCL